MHEHITAQDVEAARFSDLEVLLRVTQSQHFTADELLSFGAVLRAAADRAAAAALQADLLETVLESIGWAFIWQLRRRPDMAELLQAHINAISWPNVYIERDVKGEVQAARRHFETTERDLVFTEGAVHFYIMAQVH